MAPDDAVRTAVVVVHGMGEQRPRETLDGFVKTALRPRLVDGQQAWDYYYSRPAEITGSYEARLPSLATSRHCGHRCVTVPLAVALRGYRRRERLHQL